MAFVTLLNHREHNVIFLCLSEEMVCEISDKYGNDLAAWIAETDLEEKFSFELSECSYMMTDEVPEMYGCDARIMQEQRLFLFS